MASHALTTDTEKLRNADPDSLKVYYFLYENSGLGSVLIRFFVFLFFVRAYRWAASYDVVNSGIKREQVIVVTNQLLKKYYCISLENCALC